MVANILMINILKRLEESEDNLNVFSDIYNRFEDDYENIIYNQIKESFDTMIEYGLVDVDPEKGYAYISQKGSELYQTMPRRPRPSGRG